MGSLCLASLILALVVACASAGASAASAVRAVTAADVRAAEVDMVRRRTGREGGAVRRGSDEPEVSAGAYHALARPIDPVSAELVRAAEARMARRRAADTRGNNARVTDAGGTGARGSSTRVTDAGETGAQAATAHLIDARVTDARVTGHRRTRRGRGIVPAVQAALVRAAEARISEYRRRPCSAGDAFSRDLTCKQRGPSAAKSKPRGKPKRAVAARRPSAKAIATLAGKPSARGSRTCPGDMVSVWGKFCVDRYEAFVDEITPSGERRRHSPFQKLDKYKRYVAANERGRMPQAYISQRQAASACALAGKRLCTSDEWVKACKGKRPTTWPYGEDHRPGRCNDSGRSPMRLFYAKGGGPLPKSAYTFERMNDPRLNQPEGTSAPSGKFGRCRNSFRIYDMVGNLHEWVADGSGTFRGGYYLDVKINGSGCDYRTVAHGPAYHDYSTGFRCCK